MDINVTLKIESPEIMASILALAESLTQMELGIKYFGDKNKIEGKSLDRDGVVDKGDSGEGALFKSEANNVIESRENQNSSFGERKNGDNTSKVVKSDDSTLKSVKNDNKRVTLEEVRGKLVALNQQGKQMQVKKLFEKYGVRKITDLKPKYYEALLHEAESLCTLK